VASRFVSGYLFSNTRKSCEITPLWGQGVEIPLFGSLFKRHRDPAQVWPNSEICILWIEILHCTFPSK
jgi:hypothetical protein